MYFNLFVFCFNVGESPVFKAMLEADFKESNQSIIRIDDFDYDVVMQMLEYIYTSKAPKIDEMADRLLAIAEKVRLIFLKLNETRWHIFGLIKKNLVDTLIYIFLYLTKNMASRWKVLAKKRRYSVVQFFFFLVQHYTSEKKMREVHHPDNLC